MSTTTIITQRPSILRYTYTVSLVVYQQSRTPVFQINWNGEPYGYAENPDNWIFYVYWTVHHLDNWIKRDQLDVTCFIISLFNAQHVSDINTSIPRSLRLICWVISWVVLLWFDVCWCYVVVWLWLCGIRMQAEALQNNTTHEITQQISRKLLRMDVLTSETCWALNNGVIKQVTSSWFLFIQLDISLKIGYIGSMYLRLNLSTTPELKF